MSDVQLFSNKPKFCQKPLTTTDTLALPVINMMIEANPDTSSQARCGDPNLGTLVVKNLYRKNIRCGGTPIDINFMMHMFPNMSDKSMVDTKTWYNHYICDIDMNIQVASPVTAPGPGQPVTFQLLRGNHGGSGTESYPAAGFTMVDKENNILLEITKVDTTVPYAHTVTVVPYDQTVTVSLKANKAYLISPARIVGGCNCPIVTNSLSNIGYSQKVQPFRVRRDYRICIDLLTGYPDRFQFAITYDMNGNPVDSWMIKEQQDMRDGIQAALNILAFMGTPVTNQNLISGTGAVIDVNHPGFYGLYPSLKYGGGNVYGIPRDYGFDWETDGEAIFLFQDSRKRTKKFTGLVGQEFLFNMDDRSNKLVRRTDVGAVTWEAYQRLEMDADRTGGMAKLGVDSYSYRGFGINLKKMDSWSDYRYIGNDKFNSMAIFMPEDGTSENGRPLNPLEFYTYGNGQWTGQYEEHYTDHRNIDGCNDISGWAAESMAMATHCPEQWILVEPYNV